VNRSRRRAVLVLALFLAVGLTGSPMPAIAVQVAHPRVVSDDPANWTPNVLDGRVLAILQMGNKVIAGGTFTQVQAAGSTQTLSRSRIFAFDMNTGAIDQAFAPQLSGTVEALAPGPDGQSVIVGGAFGTVNGSSTGRRLVRLNLSNGQAVGGFAPNPGSSVRSLVLRGSWLYASGNFQQIGGQSRSGVARLNPTTGAVDGAFNLPFTGPQNGGGLIVRKIDVSPDGSRLVAIGNFSQVAGQPRNQIAIVDLAGTPSLSSWQTDQFPFFSSGTTTWCSASFATWPHDVDISPDGSYFVVVTTGAYRANRLCDTVTRWELSASGPGQLPTWVDWSGGDTFWGVGVTGSAIYVGGHPRWMNNPYAGDSPGPGAVPREGIAALDPVNGLPFSWDPGRARGVGTFDIVGTAAGLFVGSDTDRFAGELRRKIAFLPLGAGGVIPPSIPYSLPGDLYRIQLSNGSLSRRSFDGTTFGPATTLDTGIDWSTTRGAFALGGRVFTGRSDGTLGWRTFDGGSFGPSNTVNLFGLQNAPPTSFLIPGTTTPVPSFSSHLASMTGMFFDRGRIYYTVSGHPRLYYRYFTPESSIVGANLFVGSATSSIDWSNVRGMTMASGSLYLAFANGTLARVAWSGGQPTGAPFTIGGPAIDGIDWSSRGLFVFSGASDTQAPTAPGEPTGTSSGFDSIDLTWTASTDESQPLTYRIYRDGGGSPIDSVQSDDPIVSYSDTGLVSGSTHTYSVDALDPAGNVSPRSPVSDPITVQSGGAVFADTFSSGSFAAWSVVNGLTIDGTSGAPTAPSARGAPSNAPAFAYRNLASGLTSLCVSARVNLGSQASGVDLIRLRTAGGGPIMKAFAHASGRLYLRSDFTGTQRSTNVALGAGWHLIELCGTVGTSTSWTIYRDGTPLVTWTVSSGTTAVGRVQIGDTAAKTWGANFDDVLVDAAPG
jgi:Domain of unknown function (DUF5122) beta-propeller